jgi:predicted  nucleic acid-binding Zn-ribbon protein
MMEQPPLPAPPPNPEAKPVPEELLGQLHEANDRFHKGREQVEAAMDGTEYRHQERINQAAEELRRAEREVEEVEQRIEEELGKAGNGSNGSNET